MGEGSYYMRNRDRLLARQRERDANRAEDKQAYNRDRYERKKASMTARMREYYAENKADFAQKRAVYYSKNKAAHIERALRREGKIKQSARINTPAQQVEIDGMYLFTECFPWFEVDHIVPLNGKKVSGLHVVGNLQVLPREQNRAKRNHFCPAEAAMVQLMRIDV